MMGTLLRSVRWPGRNEAAWYPRTQPSQEAKRVGTGTAGELRQWLLATNFCTVHMQQL